MEPLKLSPPLKDYLWGGQKLKQHYHKISDMDKVAESWELSCHKDGVSIIKNGALAGKSLPDYLQEYPEACGTNAAAFAQFPILIKLIDAADNLSVQVHPNNDYALRVEGEYGKTEMWYVVEAEAGAELIYGFQTPLSEEAFATHIENNTLLDVVNRVPVQAGDVFFIEAGTLHGIGKGIVIAEIQQNSNTTYRVYDYGRVGADGKPRELHVEKALEVTNRTVPTHSGKPLGEPIVQEEYTQTLLADCQYFTTTLYDIDGEVCLVADETSFHAILVVEGGLELDYGFDSLGLIKGDTVFVPAELGEYALIGSGKAILTTIEKQTKE